MTAQFSHHFENYCPGVDLAGMGLYRIFKGDPVKLNTWSTYAFNTQPDPSKLNISSACWRGFIEIIHLTEEGRLQLSGFKYPLTQHEPDTACENAVGNFWLMFCKGYTGNRLYLPFVSGFVIKEKDYWIEEKRPAQEQMSSPFLQRFLKRKIA